MKVRKTLQKNNGTKSEFESFYRTTVLGPSTFNFIRKRRKIML